VNRRIAYVTYDQLPAGTDDDARTIPLLAARGVTAIPTIWNDPGVDWSSYDLVVIRSPCLLSGRIPLAGPTRGGPSA
jgi:hypothetical protein